MSLRINYGSLPTEQNNPRSRAIDRVSVEQALRIINKEDASVARDVSKAHRAIARGVKCIVSSLSQGGRLLFVGAGTSGRLGVLEAAECPPTFGTPPSLVQAYMAGGKSSVFRSKEGAEDKGKDGRAIVKKKALPNDVVVGIAASGVTPYVQEALKAAKKKKCKTLLVTCSHKVSKSSADVVIAVNTGPEVIAGSTRLKAGTATKLVLNALTVTAMIQLGKVFQNWMVDLQPKSNKLKARSLRLVSMLGQVSPKKAGELLKKSKGQTKTAIVMARRNIDFLEAQKLLKKAQGRIFHLI